MNRSCLLMLAVVGMVACNILPVRNKDTIQKQHSHAGICETKECLKSAADLASSMDTTADPCEDFYQYACGNWGEEHPRPPDMAVDETFDFMAYTETQVDILVRDFLTRNSSASSRHPRAVQQARDMYKACLNSKDELKESDLKTIINVLETLGLRPLPTYNDNMNKFDDSYSKNDSFDFDWLNTVIKAKTYLGMNVFIQLDVKPDPVNTTRFVISMGKPSATNLVKHGSNTKFDIYYKGEHKTQTTIKPNDADSKVTAIMNQLAKFGLFESSNLIEKIRQIKNVYISVDDAINQIKTNNNDTIEPSESGQVGYYSVAELQRLCDQSVKPDVVKSRPILWKRYLEEMFNMSDVSIDVENMKIMLSPSDFKYLTQIAAYVAKTPPGTLKLYIWMEMLNKLLNETYKVGNVTSSDCVRIVENNMCMAVSYGIIDPRSSEVSKPKTVVMLNEIKNALKLSMTQAKWMDDITKQASYQKLAVMKSFLGYPDWLFMEGKLDEYYKGLEIQTDSHLKNMISVNHWRVKKEFNELHSGSNESWPGLSPITVNAEYMPDINAINIPQVMLQYFDNLGLLTLNYAKLGRLFGHEITHGFDNTGRQYDKNGNKLQWWTNETISLFEKKTQCFVGQYSDYYIPEIDKHVNGNNTLGENIADNGGIHIALQALKTHLGKTGPEAKLQGFEQYTSEQMFFLSFANKYCEISPTKESLTRTIIKDQHAPLKFRVLGPLQNSPDFARAYKCKSGSKMNPEKKCILY